MIKVKGIYGENKLRWSKSFKSIEELNEWVKINKVVINEQKEIEDKPTVDNDYTCLDSFLSNDVSSISDRVTGRKSLNEGEEEQPNDDTVGGFDNRIGDKDEIGMFWVVTKPSLYKGDTVTSSTLIDVCFKSTILGMANQIRGGLKEEQIWGFYKDKAIAVKIAKELIKDGSTWFHKD